MRILDADGVRQLGVVLFVGAHPDDETFIAGGLLAAAAANGQRVVVVTATRGEWGIWDESRWPQTKLADIRTKESEAALQCLGVSEHHWFDYPDGGCDKVDEAEAVEKLRSIIAGVKPTSIVTFGPEGLTGHADHIRVSGWTAQAAGSVPVYHFVQDAEQYHKHLKDLDRQFNVYFGIDHPPLKDGADCAIALQLTPELLQKKLDAFRAMPSQYETMFSGLSAQQLEHMFNLECFVKAD
jgi:LmbE family N-acetylglucosaminyl deacetylase